MPGLIESMHGCVGWNTWPRRLCCHRCLLIKAQLQHGQGQRCTFGNKDISEGDRHSISEAQAPQQESSCPVMCRGMPLTALPFSKEGGLLKSPTKDLELGSCEDPEDADSTMLRYRALASLRRLSEVALC